MSCPESLCESINRRIDERLPLIPRGFSFTLKELLGDGFWDCIGKSQASGAGQYFAFMVASGELGVKCTNPEKSGTRNYEKI